MSLQTYNDQQSRVERAFSTGGSCCTAHCEACGRTYFVTSEGHGDYEEGELERLRERAAQDDGVIEVPDFSYVADMHHPFTGNQVVVGCLCDPTKGLAEFLETWADEICKYLEEYQRDKGKRAAQAARRAIANLRRVGWSAMDCAPKDGTKFLAELERPDGSIAEVEVHWGQDLSGEEQPPFAGWFERTGDHFSECFPLRWRKLRAKKS